MTLEEKLKDKELLKPVIAIETVMKRNLIVEERLIVLSILMERANKELIDKNHIN